MNKKDVLLGLMIFVVFGIFFLGASKIIDDWKSVLSPTTKHNPIFKAGECAELIKEDREEWESPTPIIKILKVGKHKYLYSYYVSEEGSYGTLTFDMNFSLLQSVYKLIECPKEK